MGNFAQIIGRNIRKVMDESGVTILELSELINVTRQTMAKYLDGDSIIDSEKLFVIAEYFNKPMTYFLKQDHEELAFMFRAHNPTKNFVRNEKYKIQSLMERVYEAYKLAGQKISYIPQQYNLDIDPNWREIPRDIDEIIEEIALEQRELLDVGEAVGLALIKCFEAKGIRIIFDRMDNENLFGLSAFHEKKGCFIFVNDDYNIPEERKIFTIVHEYAHLLFDRSQYRESKNDFQYFGRRRSINEKIADAFAGYFLIPRDTVKSYDHLLRGGKILYKDLLFIKNKLVVSLKSLIYALKKYGYISEIVFRNSMKYLNATGYSKKEPYPIEYFEKNEEFESIVRSLFQKNVIGVSKVAELLDIKVAEAREKIEDWIKNEGEIQEFL
ncbi:MAG TPA: ImmA/IrrE family metallo-endopeptidase [Gallicola sp.]|nr:ImmA/IrrE family metallo-endopeptidase [Gallicola sp.]